MRWVETRAYAGPDRRKRKRFRWFSRRKQDRSSPLPAIQVMLRQLHLRVLDVETAREALAQYQMRLHIAQKALRAEGQTEAALCLAAVEQTLRDVQRSGEFSSAAANEMHERAAAALCALR
ncbi:MAG: hypothetical protein JNJ63_11225 [Hyphomonadaceae bacterium]|nr:hypothetical protein [Hyphomonadaceae bacterium]